ncbi:MAG: hypothetical protein ACI4SB_02800, partial [Acutalibacteraceae bacterium]
MKNKTKTAKKLLALVLSLMMIVTAVPMMSFTSAAAEDLSTLATAINNYEAKVAQGSSTYWTGLTTAFEAYNNAKRYYDAVTYGGYDGTAAGTYATALNNAVNAMGTETEFIDYCNNITVYANSLKNETVTGATNLIYYGADPSVGFDRAWAANSNAYNWANLYFRFDIPNFVLGLDGTTTAKAPIQIYYFNSSGDATQYFNSISETTGKFSIPQFAISNTAFSTGIGTTALNQSGNWALNNPASGKYFAGNTGSTGASGTTYVNTSSYMVHQASSYLTTSNSTIGLTASNNSAQLSYTLLAVRSNNMSASYSSKSANATTNDIGYAYVVYMTDYNANYQNWKSIIPNLSYANHSGYAYADGYNAAAKLDTATTVSLAQNNFAEHGDMSGAVDDWADRIQSAANYQIQAKAAASTTISSYYNDLIGEIPTADTVYNAGQKCYTDASWTAFVNAYNAAKTHMANLSPKGTNSQYSTDNSTVGTLYLNLQAARLGLTLKDVTEDGHDWMEVSGAYKAATCETAGQRGYICNVCNQTKIVPIDALGHNYSGAVNNLGNGTHNWACTNGCGTYGTLTGGKDATVDCTLTYANTSDTQHTATCSICGYNVTENHTWSTTGTVITDATCATDGKMGYPCTNCSGVKYETISATGVHTWTNTTTYVKTAATCGADAVYYQECSVCHASSEGITDSTWTATGSATGAHTWNDGVVTEAATCTEEGVMTYTCTVCGETKTEAISATGHTPVSADNAVAATCT